MGFHFIDETGVQHDVADLADLADRIASAELTDETPLRADDEDGWHRADRHPAFHAARPRAVGAITDLADLSVPPPPGDAVSGEPVTPPTMPGPGAPSGAAPPLRPIAASPPPLWPIAAARCRALRRKFTLCKWLTLAVAMAVIVGPAGQIWTVARLEALVDAYGYGHIPTSDMPPIAAADLTAKTLWVMCFLGIWALTFLAMHAARRASEEAGISGYRFGFGWIVVGLVVPIWSFVGPWLGLDEIRRALIRSVEHDEGGDGWRRRGGLGGATAIFWLAVVGGSVAIPVAGYLMKGALVRPSTAVAFYANLGMTSRTMEFNLLVDLLLFGMFFVYLATLQRWLDRLLALAAARSTF